MPPFLSLFLRKLRVLVTTTPLRIALFLAIAAFGVFTILRQSGGMNTFHDAQFLSAYERNARITTLHFGEVPLWDPFSCGGMYGLAAPQTRYASPFFLFSLLFGVDRGAALIALFLPVIGMEGMFRWARSWGALPTAAFLTAPLFPLSGWFAYSWHWGWVHFTSFCLLPWILFGLRGALRGDKRGAVLVGVMTAITAGFGGTYTLPMAVLPVLGELGDALLPTLAILRSAEGKQAFRRRAALVGRGLLWSLPLVVGVGAYRLWPMVESVGATLRVMGGEPQFTVDQALGALTRVATTSDIDVGHFYLAPVVLVGVFAIPFRRSTALWVGAILAFLLSLGHYGPHAPFVLLRKLPIYDTLRYPERYLLLFGMTVPILAARGISLLLAVARRTRLVPAALVSAVVCVAVAFGVNAERKNTDALAGTVSLEPSPVEGDLDHFRQSRGNRWIMSHFAAEGLGSIACGEAYPVPMSRRLRGDLPAEEYLEDASKGSVTRTKWSPDHLDLAVTAREPARVLVNQNWHPGWKANVGEVVSVDGLLGVDVPAGEHSLHLDFRPRSGVGGLWVSFLSFALALLWLVPPSRLRGNATAHKVHSALFLAGPLLLAALLLAWREPHWDRPEPRTFDGLPVVVPRAPTEAMGIHAAFGVPLVMEAAEVHPAPGHPDELIVDLYLRKTGSVSANVGLFLRVDGEQGFVARGDHSEISGSVYFARMKVGAIYRDRFRIPVPANGSGKPWVLRAGFWNAYGDGKRIAVTSRGAADVDDNAVLVGHVE